jgi:hypothetical protein
MQLLYNAFPTGYRFRHFQVADTRCRLCLASEESLDEMKLTDIPVKVEGGHRSTAVAAAHGVPKGKEKGSNHWKKIRAGAHQYFNASPEEQHAMRKQAHEVLGKGKLMGDEASNPKLAKSGETIPKYHTKGLTLAPSTMSGIDTCPAASKECKAACLGSSAGRAHMSNVKDARINKTHKYFNHPHLFYAKLDHEIETAKKTAHKNDQKLAVRLNVASDIPHEHLAPHLFNKHKDVQFYDYTKVHGRTANKKMPDNYHLTVSSTGVNHKDSNWSHVRKHLDKGGVAAMAFRIPSRGKAAERPLPTHVHDEETGKKYRVIDGDEHDHRHLDKKYHGIPDHEGVIAGLKFKGGGPNIARAGNFAVPHEGSVAVAKKGQN